MSAGDPFTNTSDPSKLLPLPSPEVGSDDEVRAIFVRLITFVAAAKASHDMKNDALQCIEVLQARLLP